jgi:hypothetical protein
MNNQSNNPNLNWLSFNNPLKQSKIQPDPTTIPVETGLQPKTVKMVRPFAEAEELERKRREQKAIEKAEKEAKMKEDKLKEAETEPKTVKMVRPFAEAEAIERKNREMKEKEKEKEKLLKIEKPIQRNTAANNRTIQSSTQNIPDTPAIIPDQLNITIRTSVPGYQKIEYKPSMTIKDSDSKGVQFNPLIRLNSSTIDKIPKEYRIKQFFNKGLFQSLLTYNGGSPSKNLNYATRAGYVDNNIKVTLDNIFPVNSVIYIGKNPYAIGDIQWTTGDWRIEVKQKKVEIDPNKITDPRLYTELVREEIISGEEQLNQLPKSLIVGNNYSGPPVNVASGVKVEPSTISPTISPTITPTTSLPTSKPIALPVPKSESTDTMPIPRPVPKALELPPPPPIDVSEEAQQKQAPLLLPPPPSSSQPVVKELSPEDEKLFSLLKGSHQLNFDSMKEFVSYFSRDIFRTISNDIFGKLPTNVKEQIRKFYTFVTQSKNERVSIGLSPTMYKLLCSQVKIYKTVSNGNCFFDAVAYGINIHNYNNQNDKIYFGNYGIKQLFTIASIREIVLRYYEDLNESTKEYLRIIGDANVDKLNSLFETSIKTYPVKTDDEYMERINRIYKSDENFLVYKPESRPVFIDDEFKPFKRVTERQVAGYIRSNDYWGDQFAMQAICNKLKLYIIPIESIKKKQIINNKQKTGVDLLARVTEPDVIKNLCSNKIMFLYKKHLHYELINIYYNKSIVKQGELISKVEVKQINYPIFKSGNMPPPYHILLLIYGSNYLQIDNDIRKNYGVYPETMKVINNAVIKIVKDGNFAETSFVNKFNSVFSLDKSLTTLIARQDESKITTDSNNLYIEDDAELPENKDIIGGAYPPYSYPPYGYPPYRYPPYDSKAITKKPEQQDTSKIAYAITIDMELHPGTSLTPQQINESKCNSRYNAIKKAFSEFTGRPYVIPPVYRNTQTKKVGGKSNRITRKRH